MNIYQRWKEGMRNLTPAQQLHGKMAGLWGNIIGLSMGAVSFVVYTLVTKDFKWWWSIIVLIASVYISIMDLVGTKQQYKHACDIQDIINKER